MRIKVLIFLAAVVAFALIPLQVMSATTVSPIGSIASQGTATCQDADFRKSIGVDFTDLGGKLQKVDESDMVAVVKLMLESAELRHKYEDMGNVPADCYVAQLYTIMGIGNVEDLLAHTLAKQIDSDNAADYEKPATDQLERVKILFNKIQVELGTATATP